MELKLIPVVLCWLGAFAASFSFINSVNAAQTEIAAADAIHSPDEEVELIRQSRLAELSDPEKIWGFLDSSPKCKYISDISTPPPPRRIALTFDDGPDKDGTPYVLDVLRKYNIHATFFMKGDSASFQPELVDRVVGDGHMIVGNHSWSHPDFHLLSVKAQANQVKMNQQLLGKFQNPKFFRYPYGNSTCETNDLVHSLGYKIVGWHVDSCDWAFSTKGSEGSVNPKDARICEVQPANIHNFLGHIVERFHARNGGILLMHETHPYTIRQLDKLLEILIHDGYTFGSLDEADFQPSMR